MWEAARKMSNWFKRIIVCTSVFALVGAGWPAGIAAGVTGEGSVHYGVKKQLAPGVVHYSFSTHNWSGQPVTGHVTEIKPGEELLEIRPVLGHDALGGRETVSELAARHGAVAAVNGGFFDGASGNPIGGLVVDGQVQYHQDVLRTSVGWTGGGNFKFGYFMPGADNVPMQSGFGSGLEGIEHLVTGGPLLVQDGIPVFQAVSEGFRGGVLTPNARTAVGVKADGNVLLVVVEKLSGTGDKGGSGSGPENADRDGGAGTNASAGLTLDELAWLMVRLGSVRAAGLDGGGSSVMWAGGELVSKPSDGSERKVANALVVLYQVPAYLDGRRVYFDAPPYLEQGRTYVPLRGLFELLGAAVTWDQETQTVDAARGERSVSLTIGQKEARVNDATVLLDAVPRMVNGRTMVPLRFIGESLGDRVEWQSNPKAIKIHSTTGENANHF